jgi:phage terminase large subunit-like protein
MSSPAKDFQRLLVDADLVHDGNPVLRWMASNVAIEQDAAGNIKPSKAKSTERIDGIVAAVMALGVMALEMQPTWAMEEIGL